MTTSKPVSEQARKLATGLTFELCPHEMKMGSQLSCVKCVEAVIVEASVMTRKQTIEECARTAEKVAGNCNHSEACLVNERIAAAIRELE